MQVSIKIQRFNPEQDKKPYWKTYQVEAALNDQILDVLHKVKWYQDGTLTLRRSLSLIHILTLPTSDLV